MTQHGIQSRAHGTLRNLIFAVLLLLGVGARHALAQQDAQSPPRNVILILSDDHRYDYMSFLPAAPDFLETPNLDRMAAQGAHIVNSFVVTSLCSPSRASILTGQYTHRHGVVDNQRPVPEGTTFFPQFLQQAGFHTAYIGKWHMGESSAEPRPGFDYWVSFKGQGSYFDPTLNVNGQRVQKEGYTGDIITQYALDFLKKAQDRSGPFYLQIAYKGVHYPFKPAPRHLGRYDDAEVPFPHSMANTAENLRSQPRWVRERRYGIHGIHHMFHSPFDHDPVPDYKTWVRRYCETIHTLDQNIGRVMAYLRESGLGKHTLVIYTSDNGFNLGEHGFYDKRGPFEESIRVPMIAWAPGMIEPGTEITRMIQNIDIMPTIMDLANVSPPEDYIVDGMSFLPMLKGEEPEDWREYILYEYYWEWKFPSTPTTFMLRGQRYKYVFYYGIWDINSFYDLKTDPHEVHNLINVPIYQDKIHAMRDKLFDILQKTNGMHIPLRRPASKRPYTWKTAR